MSKAIEKRANTAHEFEQKIIELKRNIGENTWVMAELLSEIHDNAYYKELGYESFPLWLSSPDVDISKRLGYLFVDLYKTYIVERKMKHASLVGTDYTKLWKILPIVRKEPEIADEWIEKAKTLRRPDLEREIRAYTVSKRQDEIKKAVEAVPVESETVATSTPIVPAGSVFIYPSMKHLDDIAEASVDAIISYPPSGDYSWFEMVSRKLKPTGSVMLFGDYNSIFSLAPLCMYHGLTVIRDLIWYYKTAGKVTAISTLIPAHKTIIWASKSDKYTNNLIDYTKDVFEMDFDASSSHERDVPQFVANKLISISTNVKDVVLDPFCGVGTILDEARKLDRSIIGIEEDEYWFTLTKTRLTSKI
jgi:hypothetical protein